MVIHSPRYSAYMTVKRLSPKDSGQRLYLDCLYTIVPVDYRVIDSRVHSMVCSGVQWCVLVTLPADQGRRYVEKYLYLQRGVCRLPSQKINRSGPRLTK